MKLSKRIYALAAQIEQGESVSDIGTDHGYVPMLLMKNGVSPRVIMSDISDGSLARAKRTFRLCSINIDPADFRTGDGLETIEPGETEAVIIGGLGGHTIASILDADSARSRSFRKLVLQPRKHSGTLRHYLYTHGWDITNEILVPEGKFECEIITAVPSENTECREAPYPEDDIRWKYPEILVKTDPEAAARRIGWKVGSIKEQIENMKSSSSDRSETIDRMYRDLSYLEHLLNSI